MMTLILQSVPLIAVLACFGTPLESKLVLSKRALRSIKRQLAP